MRAFASKQTPARETKPTGSANFGRQVSPQFPAINRPQHACVCGGECPDCLDRHHSSLAIQKKSLEISSPTDADEREADDIARKVVDGQRAEIRETSAAVNRSGAGQAEAFPDFHATLESSKGGGRSLDNSTRSEMESKLGVDLSGVRIHTGGAAHKMNEDISAKAFTHGQDIFFRQGEFDTGSRPGKELLAHELVHTRQQNGHLPIRRQQADDWQIDPSSYCFKTQTEANERMKELKSSGAWDNYKVTSFTSKGGGDFWRVEMKGKKTAAPAAKTPESLWQKDTAAKTDVYFDTEKEANERKNKLKAQNPLKEFRILTFTLSDKTTVQWKVEMRDGSSAAKDDTKSGKTEEAVKSLGVFTLGGDPKGDKILRVAWTIDDGPQGENTEKMRGVTQPKTGLRGLKNVTWYIQKNRIRTNEDYENLKERQDEGGEIAIHSFHKSEDHSAWFPIAAGISSAYGTPYTNKDEASIMAELKKFKKELDEKKINVKFVRLPGGLISELFAYAKTLGIFALDASSNKYSEAILMSIIDGKEFSADAFDFPEPGSKTEPKAKTEAEEKLKAEAREKHKKEIREKRKTAAEQIRKDFQIFKDSLNALNLMEWSGSDDPNIIERQSWQSETSGVAARSDNTTKVVSEPRRVKDKELSIAETGKGTFEKKIAGMKPGDVRSLVILTHDSKPADADAVKADMDEMEKVAKAQKIKIEYHTMTSLFQNVTKQDPKTFQVKYK